MEVYYIIFNYIVHSNRIEDNQMGITLKKVVENINSLLNKQNSQIIITYHNYLIEKGNSINSQVAYLKAVYYYAKYLENTNIIDVKQKHEIINYLNTKIKNHDMDKNI